VGVWAGRGQGGVSLSGPGGVRGGSLSLRAGRGISLSLHSGKLGIKGEAGRVSCERRPGRGGESSAWEWSPDPGLAGAASGPGAPALAQLYLSRSLDSSPPLDNQYGGSGSALLPQRGPAGLSPRPTARSAQRQPAATVPDPARCMPGDVVQLQWTAVGGLWEKLQLPSALAPPDASGCSAVSSGRL